MDPNVDLLVTVMKSAQRELSNAPLDVGDTRELVRAAREAVDAALSAAQKIAKKSAAVTERNAALALAAATNDALAKAKFVERIMLPRSEHGTDWSAERVLLVERRERDGFKTQLFWVQAGKYYADRTSGYVPCSGSLKLLTPPSGKLGGMYRYLDKTLAEGGRLSAKMLQEHAKEIDAVFGAGVAALLDPKHTLVL